MHSEKAAELLDEVPSGECPEKIKIDLKKKLSRAAEAG
jgi:hypothetical protein